jgi:hypothetical protein
MMYELKNMGRFDCGTVLFAGTENAYTVTKLRRSSNAQICNSSTIGLFIKLQKLV